MLQAVAISLLPYLLRKFYDIRTPFGLWVDIITFVGLALLLGETADFYVRFVGGILCFTSWLVSVLHLSALLVYWYCFGKRIFVPPRSLQPCWHLASRSQ